MADHETRRIGTLDVAALGEEAALAEVVGAAAAVRPLTVTFCNAHTVNMARRDPEFREAFRGTLTLNDGIGVDIASKWLHGAPFPANLNGTDFTPRVLAALPAGTHVFLLGSAPGVAERAAERIVADAPGVVVAGIQDGFFADADSGRIVEAIRASGATLTLVAMGHPRQEKWSARHRAELPGVVMCIGALLDFLSGEVSRAPAWLQRIRLEWVYRLMLEPRRMFSRYIGGNVAFLWHIARQRMRG